VSVCSIPVRVGAAKEPHH